MFRHIKIGERIQIAGILGRLQDEIRAQRLKKKVHEAKSSRFHQTLFKPIIDSQDASTDVLKQMVNSKPDKTSELLPGKRDSAIDEVDTIPQQLLDKQITRGTNGGSYSVGNVPITLGDASIKVNGKTFATTAGLLQLIFYNEPTEPDDITEADQETYKQFLVASNYVYTNKGGVIRTNKLPPKETLKRELVDAVITEAGGQTAEGLGPIRKSKKRPVVYVPTTKREALKKLSLLLALHNAGNSAADDEALVIADYLRSKSFITKRRYAAICSLLYKDNVRAKRYR